MIKIIRVSADLPMPGLAHEMARLEFKLQVDAQNRVELAKDVAAFANGVGGTILIGVEREGERLKAFRPLARDASAKTMSGFDEAVRDWCSPKPLVEIHEIEQAGGCVVAVNVWAFPGQAVGVRDGNRSKARYFFPLRSGANTVYLTPEQLPMIMLPEIRRIAILLSQIPECERDRVSLCFLGPGISVQAVGYQPQPRWESLKLKAEFEDVVMRNTVEFEDDDGPVRIPADSIAHVWRGPAGWCVAARVMFVNRGGTMAQPL